MEHVEQKLVSRRKPEWLRIKLPNAREYAQIKYYLGKYNLHTICESGNCPNLGECWGAGTATFMILGDICTRSCGFCAVKTGKPEVADKEEANNLAEVIAQMGLKHAVITSVDRDDLLDGGAEIWANTITQIKLKSPETTLETLIPDFNGRQQLIKKVIDAKPDIISHNLETVERLTTQVRKQFIYHRSLEVIKSIAQSGIPAKSGIMLGLGETEEEIIKTMDDLIAVGCSIFTIGQYLQPTQHHLPVLDYVHPDIFAKYKIIGLEKGFKMVESGPLVRSSYHAEKHVAI